MQAHLPSAEQRNAAIYLRMSTEHQNYSLQHQSAKLAEYALAHNLVIVRTYQDAGKSGLAISGRDGLARLIHDVERDGASAFEIILVYDVSRWGRFQDVDESAHYEYICRRNGVRIEYCAELFVNDESPISSLLKSIKRTMAAEYSRELGAKVFHAQCRLARIGFKQGGGAGYGLRRIAVSAKGDQIGALQPGQHKGFSSDRVIYGIGTPEEVAVVRRIYRLYLTKKLTQTEIARTLNKEGVPTHTGRPWNLWSIKSVLSNEKYTGTLVYNRKSTKLRQPVTRNPKEDWVRQTGAFEGIVSKSVFDAAQRERIGRHRSKSQDELLDGLRAIHARHGKVNAGLIKKARLPNPKIFALRFGSLGQAYQLAGLPQTQYVRTAITKRRIAELHSRTLSSVFQLVGAAGGTVAALNAEVLIINETVRLAVRVVRCKNPWRRNCWRLPLVTEGEADFMLMVLLDEHNQDVQAYYLIHGTLLAERRTVYPHDIDDQLGMYSYPNLPSIFGVH